LFQSGKREVIKFDIEECTPCKLINPLFNKLSKENNLTTYSQSLGGQNHADTKSLMFLSKKDIEIPYFPYIALIEHGKVVYAVLGANKEGIKKLFEKYRSK